MGQPKGKTGNPLGKPKGTKNKTTIQMKEIITGFVENKLSDVMDAFDSLEPKDKVSAFTSLLKYVIPPARDTESDRENKEAISTLVERLFNRKS
ncbi:hypothetical protein [Parabacteroides provencensis]|uniref:hypothetical protein n=1 Tax=Parabacteroides provencensis TaxID=1944636 RepID=UPI000C157D3A|nr:hypothetical protein [Parabacteroides provencensis]